MVGRVLSRSGDARLGGVRLGGARLFCGLYGGVIVWNGQLASELVHHGHETLGAVFSVIAYARSVSIEPMAGILAPEAEDSEGIAGWLMGLGSTVEARVLHLHRVVDRFAAAVIADQPLAQDF